MWDFSRHIIFINPTLSILIKINTFLLLIPAIIILHHKVYHLELNYPNNFYLESNHPKNFYLESNHPKNFHSELNNPKNFHLELDHPKNFHLESNCTVPSQTRPSKQCAYQDRQVPRLGRVSLTCTGFNLN